MKRLLFFIAFMSAAALSYAADTVSYRLSNIENWAFYGTRSPEVGIVAVNGRGVSMPMDVKCSIWNYDGVPMYELNQKSVLQQHDSLAFSFAFKTIAPGFYNAVLSDGGRVVKSVNIAYEPEKILSSEHFNDDAPVSDRNFTRLLESVKEELPGVRRQFSIVKNKKLSGKEKNVYDFKMNSRDDKVIKGYLAFPRGKKGLEAMITFLPIEGRSENPLADFTAKQQMVELVIYVGDRGDGEMYFRNILTDAAICMEYIMNRPEIDPAKVYTQGEGDAAALSCVASAIDGRVRCSFVASPDFSRFLECFTAESVAEGISAPVLFGMGLQDKAVRLQEDFAVYNNIKGIKEYFIFPAGNAVERNKWKYIRDTFILRSGE